MPAMTNATRPASLPIATAISGAVITHIRTDAHPSPTCPCMDCATTAAIIRAYRAASSATQGHALHDTPAGNGGRTSGIGATD